MTSETQQPEARISEEEAERHIVKHRDIVNDMPISMAKRPRDRRGYPVPWFVPMNPETRSWDFRYMGPGKIEQALQNGLCWTCGEPLVQGMPYAFVVGPMCAVNLTSAEPPSHINCAVYSARACPFLARPKMQRPSGHEGVVQNQENIAGVALMRNPGVALVWITRSGSYTPNIRLFHLGDPIKTRWFAHSREATRAEVLESIESGLPVLMKMAEEQDADEGGVGAVDELNRRVEVAMKLIPEA
jgi:hypothetical protein